MDFVKDPTADTEEFKQNVKNGLKSQPKRISSRYLYDRKGSMLFEEIMDLPEYYLSRSEMEILRRYKSSIATCFQNEKELFVADLGAGNGIKSLVLLKNLRQKLPLSYYPIDISKSALDDLADRVKQEIPELNAEYLHNDFIRGLESLKEKSPAKKLVLFLGSSIGNFTLYEAMHFLAKLRGAINKGDYILTGFDLKKNPETIRRAYFDSKGITEKFNLNILKRINQELGGEFILENFQYYPVYNPVSGEMNSYLVSKKDQEVFIRSLNERVFFRKWECIKTECSNKYDIPVIRSLSERTGFELLENYMDEKNYFCNSLWKAI